MPPITMGQEELVLRVSGEPDGGSNSPADTANNQTSNGTSDKARLTHSRESSGASVKFVNCPPPGSLNHRRTQSKCSDGTTTTSASMSDDSHVIILPSPSRDDLATTASSTSSADEGGRLSSEEDDLMLEAEEEARLMVASDDVDVKDGRLLPPADTNSQNSDYGSFCQTPSTPPNDEENTAAALHERNCDNNTTSGNSSDRSKTSSPKPKVKAAAATNGARSRARGGAQGMSTAANGNEGSGDSSQGGARQPGAEGGAASRRAGTGVGDRDHMPLLDDLSSDDEVGANSSGYTRRKSRRPNPSIATAVRIESDVDAVDGEELADIPKEPIKTLISFIFLFFAWVATTTSLALTHERVPEVAPLPDIVLDNVNYQSWGLDASEILIMAATMFAFVLALFHQHRFVVLRRIFILGGIHYFYRAVTMYITVLPKADPHYKCAPKLNSTSVEEIARRVLKLLSGMGLSINGQHIYCGDYIYSGHTMTLLMTFLIIKEYSPKRWFLLHWMSLGTVVVGILTLLFARGHYSIDVVIAYWITTRLWWIYHTMANNSKLLHEENKHNYLTNLWWWYLFRYFEGNVGRPLPKGFNWPLPKQLRWRPSWPRMGRARRRNSGDEGEGEERADLQGVTATVPVEQPRQGGPAAAAATAAAALGPHSD